jgi:hypothetical protein
MISPLKIIVSDNFQFMSVWKLNIIILYNTSHWHQNILDPFLVFCEIQMFITVLKTACHWTLSWATWIHPISSHPICLINFNYIILSSPK